MVELNQIPHIDEIAHHGVFHGAAEKKPATFQERSASQNKIVKNLPILYKMRRNLQI